MKEEDGLELLKMIGDDVPVDQIDRRLTELAWVAYEGRGRALLEFRCGLCTRPERQRRAGHIFVTTSGLMFSTAENVANGDGRERVAFVYRGGLLGVAAPALDEPPPKRARLVPYAPFARCPDHGSYLIKGRDLNPLIAEAKGLGTAVVEVFPEEGWGPDRWKAPYETASGLAFALSPPNASELQHGSNVELDSPQN